MTPIVQESPIVPTPTPTLPQNSSIYPVAFPLPPLTKDQIVEVELCDIGNVTSERYPDSIDENQLTEQFTPKSGCDWAILAFAYALRNHSESPSPLGMEAFKNAVAENYGYVLATPIFYQYFGSLKLVEKPGFTNQEIKGLTIHYHWSGLGEPSKIEYSLSIKQANTSPAIVSEFPLINKSIRINRETIQDLTNGLSDLVPIESEIQIAPCTDNYPEWQIGITFADDTVITLESFSNFLQVGGPWEVTLDNQVYLQTSYTLVEKLSELVKALELPLGEPFGVTCFSDSVFEKAFSGSLPPTKTPEPNLIMEAINTAAFQTVEVLLTQQALHTPSP